MIETVVRKALELWGMEGADVSLAAHRENTVFRLGFQGLDYALRLHCPGYRNRFELQSELEWMNWLKTNGLRTPEPVTSGNGSLCHKIDGIVVDVLSWLDGETLTRKMQSASADELDTIFLSLGRTMAELHNKSDEWDVPNGFQRPSWNLEGLVGEAPVWGRFWENPVLTPEQCEKLVDARAAARELLDTRAPQLDYGLIHADIIPDNVLVSGSETSLIDFDDGGFGFRLFDLATTLNKIPGGGKGVDCQSAFLKGYQSVRQIDLACLPLFSALRSFTYIGWIMTRLDQPDAKARLQKFLAAAELHFSVLKE